MQFPVPGFAFLLLIKKLTNNFSRVNYKDNSTDNKTLTIASKFSTQQA
jgi:hypothetical protein